MAIPNMATVTASLQRSLQNCSLNHQHTGSRSSSSASGGDSPENPPLASTTPTLELNSEAALPFHWEQCLDLKTGEIYYINWRTGMRSEEDPRRITTAYDGDYYSEEDDISSYDSEGSCAREQWSGNSNNNNKNEEEEENCYGHGGEEDEKGSGSSGSGVLVVAGCKVCFMYYMVPKQNKICPKCCGQLIHFDRSENASP